MEERIKAIIKSRGWSEYKVQPVEANTFAEKMSIGNYMWQIVKNGGSLFVKEITGEMYSGTVSIVSENPQVLEPEKIPYKYPIIIGVGQSLYGRVFNVFIERDFFGDENERIEVIYSSSDLKYVDENIDKILRRVVEPDYYSEKTTIERRSNYGVISSNTDMKFPNIEKE